MSSLILKKVHARWKIDRSYYYRDKLTDVLVGCETLNRSGIERDLDCLRAIGLKPLDKNPELFITKKETEWADKFLLQKGVDPLKKLVIIHVSTSKSYTDWGMDNFIKLAGKLINDYGHQVLACFPEKEESIFAYLPNPTHRRAETYNFAKYISEKYNIPIKVLEFVEDEYEEVEPWIWRYTV